MKKIVAGILVACSCMTMLACNSDKKYQEDFETFGQETTQAELEYRNDVSVKDMEAAVAEALGADYWPQMEMPSLTDIGVAEDLYEEAIFKSPMISVNVDTIIIVKAKEGQTEAVYDALNAYRDMLINDVLQYPMNLPKIQASRVEQYGNYVVFVQLGADKGTKATQDAGENTSEDDLAAMEMAAIEAENEKALNAIVEMIK